MEHNELTESGNFYELPQEPRKEKSKIIGYIVCTFFCLVSFGALLLFDILRVPLLETTIREYVLKNLLFTLALPAVILAVLFLVLKKARLIVLLSISILYVIGAIVSGAVYAVQVAEDHKKRELAYSELASLMEWYDKEKDTPLKDYKKEDLGRYLSMVDTYKDFAKKDADEIKELREMYADYLYTMGVPTIEDSLTSTRYMSIIKDNIELTDQALESYDKIGKERIRALKEFKDQMKRLDYRKSTESKMLSIIGKKDEDLQKFQKTLKGNKKSMELTLEFREKDNKLIDDFQEKYDQFFEDVDFIQTIQSQEKINQLVTAMDTYIKDYETLNKNRLDSLKVYKDRVNLIKDWEGITAVNKTIDKVENVIKTKHSEFLDQERIAVSVIKQFYTTTRDNRNQYTIQNATLYFYTDRDLAAYRARLDQMTKELEEVSEKEEQIIKEIETEVKNILPYYNRDNIIV